MGGFFDAITESVAQCYDPGHMWEDFVDWYRDADILAQTINYLIADGKRVILLAHSQGNFFVKRAMEKLRENPCGPMGLGMGQKPWDYIGVISTGTPVSLADAGTAVHRLVQIRGDGILRVCEAPEANVEAPFGGATSRTLHNFEKSYLFKDGAPYNAIVDAVAEMQGILPVPPKVGVWGAAVYILDAEEENCIVAGRCGTGPAQANPCSGRGELFDDPHAYTGEAISLSADGFHGQATFELYDTENSAEVRFDGRMAGGEQHWHDSNGMRAYAWITVRLHPGDRAKVIYERLGSASNLDGARMSCNVPAFSRLDSVGLAGPSALYPPLRDPGMCGQSFPPGVDGLISYSGFRVAERGEGNNIYFDLHVADLPRFGAVFDVHGDQDGPTPYEASVILRVEVSSGSE